MGAEKSGWNEFKHTITWDCVSSWYTPSQILMRTNLIHVFSTLKYDFSASEYFDGKFRKSRKTSNPMGEYLSAEKCSTKMSTYVQMRSQMDKQHPHEKPVELIRAVLSPFHPKKVIDCFGGSGACALGSVLSGAEQVDVYETDPDYCATIKSRIEGNK